MNALGLQLLYTLETSLLFSLVTAGLYLSFRILRFPDLTAEGGFGLAALLGGLTAAQTQSPFLGLLVGVLVGAATGAVTAILANVVKLPTILASILTLTMCFSIGLLVVGHPNQSLNELWTFSYLEQLLGSPLQAGLLAASVFLTALVAGLLLLLRTGTGFLLRVRGENPTLARELGHSLLLWDVFGLAVANGIVGLGAVLLSQRAGYANISMGRGVAISALAAIMLAEAVLPARRLATAFSACIAGTFIIQVVRLVALNFGIPDGGLDLVTSLLVIGLVWMAKCRKVSTGNVLEQIRM